MNLRGIDTAALALEPGRTTELACLPPCPAQIMGDGGALERKLGRERQIVVFVGLVREVPEYLGLTAGQAELPEYTEGFLEQRPGGDRIAVIHHVCSDAVVEVRRLDLVSARDEELEAVLVAGRGTFGFAGELERTAECPQRVGAKLRLGVRGSYEQWLET